MDTKVLSRRFGFARLSLLAGGLLLASTLQAQEARYAFTLLPQPLDRALNELARQTGTRILFATDATAGLQAPALSGELSVQQALRHL
ncbi:TPA: TonB-dependent siderophore receptor, partial [Pseudomonas aeruginosa]